MYSSTLYVSHGTVLVLLIICGLVVNILLCNGQWYGNSTCGNFSTRMGFAAGVNYIFFIINIILLVLFILKVVVFEVMLKRHNHPRGSNAPAARNESTFYTINRVYGGIEGVVFVIGCILFFIAFILVIWVMIEQHLFTSGLIISVILLIFQAMLYSAGLKSVHSQMVVVN